MFSKSIKYLGGIMCLSLFFLVNSAYAQGNQDGCDPDFPLASTVPKISTSLTETDTDGAYIYRNQNPFTVTVVFPYTLSSIALPQPNGFTRDPAGTELNNVGPALNITYTPTGTESLIIQIQAGKAFYSLFPTCANKVASDILNIRYKSGANAGAGGGTANCSDKPGTTPVPIKGVSTCVCDPSAPDPKKPSQPQCCGIKLLTTVPFIGKCITMLSQEELTALGTKATSNPDTLAVSESTAFPRLMLGLTKILVTVILLASFIAIIVAGVMMAASGSGEEGYSNGKKIIGSVIAALALLGASGVILRLVNPNFFG